MRAGQDDREWSADSVAGLCYRLGMSQQEFARHLGVRQQTVSEWETGQHNPRGASVRMLSIVAEQRAPYDVKPKPRHQHRPKQP